MMTRPKKQNSQAGFTLLELLVSTMLMTVLCGGVVLCLNTAQQSFRRTEINNQLDQQLRATQQLLTQDMGQAGLIGTADTTATPYYTLTGNDNPTPLTYLTTSITAGATTATVKSAALLFQGQTVFVGTGSAQEAVTIGTISSTSSSPATLSNMYFAQAHTGADPGGDPIFPHGVFSDGVIPTTLINSGQIGASTVNSLHLYGDLTGNGTLTVVDYVCPTANTTPSYTDSSGTVWAPLVRYEYDNALGKNTSTPTADKTMTVLDLVAVTPNGCFTYYAPTAVTVNSSTFYFITSVEVTIRAMAGVISPDGSSVKPLLDPQTNQPVTATRSFLNIQPRNIVAAYKYAGYCSGKSLTDGEIMAMPVGLKTMIAGIP